MKARQDVTTHCNQVLQSQMQRKTIIQQPPLTQSVISWRLRRVSRSSQGRLRCDVIWTVLRVNSRRVLAHIAFRERAEADPNVPFWNLNHVSRHALSTHGFPFSSFCHRIRMIPSSGCDSNWTRGTRTNETPTPARIPNTLAPRSFCHPPCNRCYVISGLQIVHRNEVDDETTMSESSPRDSPTRGHALKRGITFPFLGRVAGIDGTLFVARLDGREP